MKKLLPFISTLLVGLSIGCSYDDSELTNRIDQLEEDQKLLEQQLADGETLIESITIGTEEVTFVLTSSRTVIIPLSPIAPSGSRPQLGRPAAICSR